MGDLTDEQLESMVKIGGRGALMALAAFELRRHRATMRRLEELALSLEHNHRVEIRDIGREMRERMKGG